MARSLGDHAAKAFGVIAEPEVGEGFLVMRQGAACKEISALHHEASSPHSSPEVGEVLVMSRGV